MSRRRHSGSNRPAGEAVVKAAAGYDRAIKGVHASFYNETLASQAAKRVEA